MRNNIDFDVRSESSKEITFVILYTFIRFHIVLVLRLIMRKSRHKITLSLRWLVMLIIGAVAVEGLDPIDGGDKNVIFKEDHGNVNLYMDENIKEATLLKMENAQGNLRWEFSNIHTKCKTFEKATNLNQTSEDKWTLLVNQPLDYEEDNCDEIYFNIIDTGSSQLVFLHINNLNDNPPVFIPPILQCVMDENTPYTSDNTTCSLKITDEDGMMENTTFHFLTEEDNVKKKFQVTFKKTPEHDDKEAQVIVYLLNGIMLDFEDINFYSFSIKAIEDVQSNTFQIFIKVGDKPDQPPTWVHLITYEKFEENVDQEFQVKAIDGDIGMNTAIYYKKVGDVCENFTCKIDIDEKDGRITVAHVDREEVGDTIKFTIKAIEVDESNSTSLDITFLIQDQDDNPPVITANETDSIIYIEIDENYKDMITKFSVQDMDLLENGTFDIRMDIKEGSVNYTKAFSVIPVFGYQKAEFLLTVFNSTKLDYEDDDWKVIEFQVKAIERTNSSHLDEKTVLIHLRDLNDEPPIFVNESTVANIWESIRKGEEIFNATAVDRDAGDHVSYQIIGLWNKKLSISDGGIITPKEDRIFDYEQLQQVVLQILATDNNEVHKTYETLTINVMDVDDEPPSIRVGNNRVTVKENTKIGFKLTDVDIKATDPDTKPKLELEINWSTSTITKNSALVKTERQWQCFAIDTAPHDEEAQEITGILSISGCSPDFELYDTILIGLTVIDLNTDSRYLTNRSSSGFITINIEDVNDEPPVFLNSSLVGMEVTDGAQGPAKIGVISAHDPDINDNITFSVVPLDPDADWVEIDGKSGELKIKRKAIIDDDIPVRYNISFNIKACDTDNLHCPIAKVDIYINDVNDQTPMIIGKKEIVEIDEKSTNTVVIVLSENDADRDEPFNTVVFRFDTNITDDSANRFEISEDGNVNVRLRNGAILDRDYGAKSFILPILAYDNPKGTLQFKDHLDVKVILRDINDHSPEVINKTLNCVENWEKGKLIGQIMAEDPDEGVNASTVFEIIKIEPISVQNSSIDESFFKFDKVDDKTATLTLLRNLKGYYGKYNITIKTSDLGKPPQIRDNNSIEFTVAKFNFQRPQFKYPSDNTKVVLNAEQIPGSSSPLTLFGGGELPDLEIDDFQNHKFDVTFEVIDENGKTPSLFSIQNFHTWKARLQLLKLPSKDELKEEYKITIEANLNTEHQDGEATTSVQTQLVINFFSSSEQPTFSSKTFKATFDEKTLNTYQNIPAAKFSIPNVSPYYFLLTNEVANIFQVNLNNGSISLLEKLDCEKISSYEFKIQASTKDRDPSPSADSILDVQVEVYDVNDNSPEFHPSKFHGAFLKTYTLQSTIITINATDEDPRDKKKLHFSLGKITCIGNLSPPDPPFVIDEQDGKITPKFTVTSKMSGYCNTEVTVLDNADKYNTIHKNTTSVQINIVGDDELVKFVFMNTDSDVDNNQVEITKRIDELLENFNFRCYLSDRTFDAEWQNTTAHFYFLDNHTQDPVKAVDVFGNLTDVDNFTKLKKSLGGIGIYLGNFPTENTETTTSNQLITWLLVAVFVQASLLLILFIAFYFRNKALNRRIQNLSTTKFGSQESGLNRAGIAAPNTNKNAIEGSNPVFNSENYVKEIERDPDAESINSGDSVLFGVENNPEFDI